MEEAETHRRQAKADHHRRANSLDWKLGGLILALACFGAPVHAGQFYKCKDENGATMYSESPCGGESESVRVQERPVPATEKIELCQAPRDGTPAEIELLRKSLRTTLYDAQSALFEAMRVCDETQVFCVKVNAKNRFGAYVGFRSATGEVKDGQVAVAAIDDADTMRISINCTLQGLK